MLVILLKAETAYSYIVIYMLENLKCTMSCGEVGLDLGSSGTWEIFVEAMVLWGQFQQLLLPSPSHTLLLCHICLHSSCLPLCHASATPLELSWHHVFHVILVSITATASWYIPPIVYGNVDKTPFTVKGFHNRSCIVPLFWDTLYIGLCMVIRDMALYLVILNNQHYIEVLYEHHYTNFSYHETHD